jgi:putative transposase
VLNVAFGEIRRQLEYKCRWYGSELVAVNPAFTSQRCSACGNTEAGNRTSQAVFCCLNCGHAENADHNAAKNILEAGIGLPAVGLAAEVCGGKASASRRNRNPAA